jgi:hypothetical protein
MIELCAQNPAFVDKIGRIVQVWHDRRIFSVEAMARVCSAIGFQPKSGGVAASAAPASSAATSPSAASSPSASAAAASSSSSAKKVTLIIFVQGVVLESSSRHDHNS